MSIINEAENGFPFQKVAAAQEYLVAIKPVWTRFSKNMEIVPSSTPPFSDEPFAAIASTDPDGYIYLDNSFARYASIEELAGVLEFEYHIHARRFWSRLPDVSDEEWRDFAAIAISLEINSAIDREEKTFPTRYKELISHRSRERIDGLPPKGFFDKYEISGPPTTRTLDSFRAEDLGLQPGLSAERYFSLLKEARDKVRQEEEEEEEEASKKEPEDQSGQGENQEEGALSEISEGSPEENDQSQSLEDGQGGDVFEDELEGGNHEQEHGRGSEDSENGEGGENLSGEGEDADSDESGETESAGSTEGESGESENPSKTPPDAPKTTDPKEGVDEEGVDLEEPSERLTEPKGGEGRQDNKGQQRKNDSTSPEGAESTDSDSSGMSEKPESGHNDQGEPSGNPENGAPFGHDQESLEGEGSFDLQAAQELVESLNRALDNDRSFAWKSSLFRPTDDTAKNPMVPEVMPFVKEKIGDQARVSDALDDFSEDILEFSQDPGLIDGNSEDPLIQEVYGFRRSKKVDFASKQRRVMTSAVQSAKTSGATDMSLSVRNPNQPMIGPILAGVFDYSPRIYFIQDVSKSMSGSYTQTAGEVFSEVCSDVAANFGAKTLWIAIDFTIREVSETSVWSKEDIWKTHKFGGGITHISDLAVTISKGKLRHKGVSYPEPDVLAIMTDGEFVWPEERPRVKTKWIVTTLRKSLGNFPDWLRPDEIVVID